ncbi:response regulator receiver [Thioploca ingrica]|uniref:histidine kinase n=1 Tax=Thioploca ingrica TaxID=40754 RepID=A0A090AKI1_9GAMM|nr:response regulator receiver [Thioploca ingrica]
MNWFNHLRVGTKMMLGYLIILLLVTGIGAFTLLRLQQINHTIRELAEQLAYHQNLADEMVAKILATRLQAIHYIHQPNSATLTRYQEEIVQFNQLLAQAAAKITRSPRVELLAKIKAELQAYQAQFEQVTQLITEQQQIFSAMLTNQDSVAAQQLEQLRTSAVQANDAPVSVSVGQLQRALLLMQLDTSYYLRDNQKHWLEQFQQHYREAAAVANQLQVAANNPQQRELVSAADPLIKTNYQAFNQLQINSTQQNQILETQVEVIGTQVRQLASQLSAGIKTDFQHENQAMQAIISQTSLVLLITVGFTIAVGLSLGVAISKNITIPLTQVTYLANQMAEGNVIQIVEKQQQRQLIDFTQRQDEIGQIGQAFFALNRYFQEVIEDILLVSQGLVMGNLAVSPEANYKGDLIQIKRALEMGLANLRLVVEDLVKVSQGLADGHLQVKPVDDYPGDFIQIKDAFETTLGSLRQVIEDIVQVSQGLAEGRLEVRPTGEYRGQLEQIKTALETAAIKLAEVTTRNLNQDWLKTGLAQLNDRMKGEQDVVKLAKNIITFLSNCLQAQVGVFYLLQPAEATTPRLKLIASYAYTRRQELTNEFQLGEGVVGQVAVELQPILLVQIPDDYLHIGSGLGAAVPRNLIVVPFLYENTLKGVVEIGTFQELTPIQLEFLNQAMPNIGIAINTAQSREQMQVLLQQTQAQAKALQQQTAKLQAQQEELQQANEELQSQSEELQTRQEELRQANEELQSRTQELEQQQAEIQEKNLALEKTRRAIEIKAEELELASQYKSEFLANMSHELRTPLNSLLVLAQLLAENKAGNLNDKQIEYVHTIYNAGSDLLMLINDILDLSKVEAGKIEINLEAVSITELIEGFNQKFHPLAESKGINFQIIIAPDLPPTFNTDVQRLKQIINNLLANAFKFTHQGGNIQLLWQRPLNQDEAAFLNLDPRRSIAISIVDTGIGVLKEKQQIIFEAFQQADGTTNRRYGGTGLGLSISRQLARLLGGDIRLHSEEGKGSTFILYLPEQTRPNNSLASATLENQSPPSLATGTTLRPEAALLPPPTAADSLATPVIDDRDLLTDTDKVILIIEDDSRFSRLLRENAQEKGFKYLLAEEGRTGLQLAQYYQPHAIILDVSLPQVDGWTVMEKLKDNPHTRHIPVHFISAADQEMTAKRMGAIGYLLKPVNLSELEEAFKKIERFLANPIKNLLLIADTVSSQQKILELIASATIRVTVTSTIAEAHQHLHHQRFDCIILDLNVEQGKDLNLLELLEQEEQFAQIPLIISAERELTAAEEKTLQSYMEHLTIKTVYSPERLLDEATLFLHQVEAHLPSDKRNMIRMVHDKTTILRNKKILLVDDDVRNTFALATVLEDNDMEIIVATNGKEALRKLNENKDIVMVIMDMMMPEMDGYEAMRTIRTQPNFHNLPIIALTAKAMKGDKAKCIEAGANDYLSKPVNTDKLISLMRVWLYR